MQIETKINIGDRLYLVTFIDNKYFEILSAVVHHITFMKDGYIRYYFYKIKHEAGKSDIFNDSKFSNGFCLENVLDDVMALQYLNIEHKTDREFSFKFFSSKNSAKDFVKNYLAKKKYQEM